METSPAGQGPSGHGAASRAAPPPRGRPCARAQRPAWEVHAQAPPHHPPGEEGADPGPRGGPSAPRRPGQRAGEPGPARGGPASRGPSGGSSAAPQTGVGGGLRPGPFRDVGVLGAPPARCLPGAVEGHGLTRRTGGHGPEGELAAGPEPELPLRPAGLTPVLTPPALGSACRPGWRRPCLSARVTLWVCLGVRWPAMCSFCVNL